MDITAVTEPMHAMRSKKEMKKIGINNIERHMECLPVECVPGAGVEPAWPKATRF